MIHKLLIAACLILYLIFAGPLSHMAAAEGWSTDKSMLLFYQAMKNLRQNGLDVPLDKVIVHKALDCYLRHHDPYSRLLTRKDYQALRGVSGIDYVGVGMDIFPNNKGETVCVPHPGGPAAKMGIKSGEIIVAINGKPISKLSQTAIAARIRGPKATPVKLTIRNHYEKDRNITITRHTIRNQSVTVSSHGQYRVIRISHFNADTTSSLRKALLKFRNSRTLVLDLRSNRGGNLYSAIDAVGLFLPKGSSVVKIRSKNKTEKHASLGKSVKNKHRIFLLQDQYTASAAELFIAAMVQNKIATAIGHTSFGKGSTQQIFPLQDGSALLLTTGILYGPNGKTWNLKGLKPSRMLPKGIFLLQGYLSAIPVPTKHTNTAKRPARPSPASATASQPKYYIQIGGYNEFKNVEDELFKSFKSKIHLNIVIFVRHDVAKLALGEITKRIHHFKREYHYQHLDTKIFKSNGTRFVLRLGPYDYQNDDEFNRLMNEDSINPDAFWIKLTD